MKKSILYIFFIIINVSSILSTPQISQVDGDLGYGGLARIQGSSFGTHTLDIESTLGPNGWIEANSPNTIMQQLGDYDGTQIPEWFTFANSDGNEPKISSLRAYSLYQSVDASVTTQYTNPMLYTHDQTFDKIYATWYVYFDPTTDETLHYDNNSGTYRIKPVQWKMWRVNDCGADGDPCLSYTKNNPLYVNDNCGDVYSWSHWRDNGQAVDQAMTLHCLLDCGENEGVIGNNQGRICYYNAYPSPFYPPQDNAPEGYGYFPPPRTDSRPGITYQDLLPTPRGWSRVEIYLDRNDIDGGDDGSFEGYIYKPGRERIMLANLSGLQIANTNCCRDATRPWMTFVLQNYFDNSALPRIESAQLFYDDIYLQFGTRARVEICDSNIWEQASKCEVQQVATWNDNQIEFLTNYGGFSQGSTAWLYIIKDNGEVSNPVSITLNGDGGPSCYDGVQNQGEQGVDCQGPCERACPTCSDGIQNQDEVQIDCGGPNCQACPLEEDIITLRQGILLPNNDTYTGQYDVGIQTGWNCQNCNLNFPNAGGIGNSYGDKMLMHFDLSSIPPRNVISATLRLYETNSGSGLGPIRISRIIKPWNFSTVTYRCLNDNNFNGCTDPGEIPWDTQGLGSTDYSDSINTEMDTGENFYNLTSYVSYWLENPEQNYGFLLELASGNLIQSFGTDSSSINNQRPELNIIFESSTNNSKSCLSSEIMMCDTIDNDCDEIIDEYCNQDTNGDSLVDIEDLYNLAAVFKITPAQTNLWKDYYDQNSDNVIDIIDILIVANNFRNS